MSLAREIHLSSSINRGISPPPLKRRRLSSDGDGVLSPDTKDEQKSLVIFSWNVNGIEPLLQKKIDFSPNSKYPLRKFLESHKWPYMLCLQEVKINRADEGSKRRVELAANVGSQSDPTYTTFFSLPRDKYNATGFGGKVHGVATLVRDDVPDAGVTTSKPDWDLEGRVLVHEFKSLPLVVINGYWVNGTANSYRSPETGVIDGNRHDHKLRFHESMLDLCKSIEQRGKSVLLVGDMNVAPSRIDGHPNLRTTPVDHVRNRKDFNAKFLDGEAEGGFRGVDLFRHFHGDTRRYTYHGRGRPWGQSCDRVDLMITSRNMVKNTKAVTACDICDTPQERGHSDHVPLWASVDAARIKAIV